MTIALLANTGADYSQTTRANPLRGAHNRKFESALMAPGAYAREPTCAPQNLKLVRLKFRSPIFQLNRTLGKIDRAALEGSHERVYPLLLRRRI